MDDVIEYNKESFTVDADNLLNFIKFRRSIRNFKSKKIEKEKIEKIIEAGRFTQTSTNSQDVSYTIVIDKLDKLKDLAFESLNKKGEYILYGTVGVCQVEGISKPDFLIMTRCITALYRSLTRIPPSIYRWTAQR